MERHLLKAFQDLSRIPDRYRSQYFETWLNLRFPNNATVNPA